MDRALTQFYDPQRSLCKRLKYYVDSFGLFKVAKYGVHGHTFCFWAVAQMVGVPMVLKHLKLLGHETQLNMSISGTPS